MAVNACALSDSFIPRLDLNGIVIILKSKCNGVKEPVVALRHPLPHEIMRQVTIVTLGNVMMTTFLPTVEVILHHVTVDTSGWVVAEVACAFSIAKRKCSDAGKDSQHDREQQDDQ